ncbi:DUF1385 domain-containing protein [Acetitomaculum ruminis]
MKYSGIGGQAVLEGVMMRNGDKYAVAVRKPDGEIAVESREYKGLKIAKKVKNLPLIRGMFGFVDSLILGMQSLNISAEFFMDEEALEEPGKFERFLRDKLGEKTDDIIMGVTMVTSIIIAIAVFMMLPYFLSIGLTKLTSSKMIIAIAEGVLRLFIFLAYIKAISYMKDIQRVFMYHGAEHKCINCIEHGLELTVENVRKSSRQHKRCGTSFLLFVMIVSIIFFFFIRVDSPLLKVVLRLALVPVIAGVSYEIIRLAGKYDNFLVNLISKPGLMLQGMTTKEPDDDMIEVGIASVDAVFDWRGYLRENFDNKDFSIDNSRAS